MGNIELDNVQTGYLDSILFGQEQQMHETLLQLSKEKEKLTQRAKGTFCSKKDDTARIEEIKDLVRGCNEELAMLKELRSKLGDYYLEKDSDLQLAVTP